MASFEEQVASIAESHKAYAQSLHDLARLAVDTAREKLPTGDSTRQTSDVLGDVTAVGD